MDERYAKLATPPVSALKKIEAGRLKGFTDINAQWKIEAMTEVYGLCGVGWKFAIGETNIIDLPTGEKMIFMKVILYIKDGEKWSEPIYGCGGDFIVKKEKAGLRADDDAYKKCLTDALGNAMKCLGVASDVYRGISESKYDTKAEVDFVANRELWKYINLLNENDIDPDYFSEVVFNKAKEDLSDSQISAVVKNLDKAIAEFRKRDAGRQEEIPM